MAKATVSKKVKTPEKAAAPKQLTAADIATQFSQLSVADRIKLHRDLQAAINRDIDLQSSGREADASAYQTLIDSYNQ